MDLGSPDSGQGIGQWSTSTLIRFIRDLFEKDPPILIGQTAIDELRVNNTLTIQDRIKFSRDMVWHTIGATGEPTFANSWVNFGSPWASAGFWKDPLGVVHFRGRIKSGTVGSTAFILPAGYRPEFKGTYAIGSNATIGLIEIDTNGTVTPVTPSNNTYVSLEGLTFRQKN